MLFENVAEVQIFSPKWDDVIVLKVDYKKIPSSVREEKLKQILTNAKEVFPNNKIMVIDTASDVSVLSY